MTDALAARTNGSDIGQDVTRLYKRLAAVMPTKSREVQGTRLNYVDVEQVVSRLNSVLGADGWSFAITERWHEQDSDCCCVRGVLTIHWPTGRSTIHEDIGGQIINRRRAEPRQAIEIANDWKGAASDCLKRCATHCGVGLFLRTKAQQLSEIPDDRPERDRGSSSREHMDAPKPAAADRAGVAQGTGAGGVARHRVPRDGTPPAQPAKRWSQPQLNRFWAQLQPLSPKVTGEEVHEVLGLAAGRVIDSIHEWDRDLDDAVRLVFEARQQQSAPAVAHLRDAAPATDEHPLGSIERSWQAWGLLKARADAAGVPYAEPPRDASRVAVDRYCQRLSELLAQAEAATAAGGGE